MRAALATLALLAASLGLAQGWSVQTVAVRDLREATSIADDLARLGYDAYTEFSMGDDGKQWVRVRVGCFLRRATAQAFAELLHGNVTRDAVVVPRSAGAPSRACVEERVGFRTSAAWRQPAPEAPVFVVEVAGVGGVVRWTDDGWRVLQEPAAESLAPAEPGGGRFAQAAAAPRPFVEVRDAEGTFFVCPGRLLAQSETAAIVEHDGAVRACRWRPPSDLAGAP